MPAIAGNRVPPAFIACGVGLFFASFVLAGVVLGTLGELMWPVPDDARHGFAANLPLLMSQLLLPVHLVVSLYDGRFGRWRTATWLLLILGWVGSVAAGFIGYILPWGQFGFWVSAQLARVSVSLAEAVGPWLAGGGAGAVAALLGLAALILDMAVLHRGTWRGAPTPRGMRPARVAGYVILAAVAAAVLTELAAWLWALPVPVPLEEPKALATPDVLATPAAIVPDWHLLPYYALLRAAPSKGGGVALLFAAILLPAIWPWARADLARCGPARHVHQVLCTVMAAAWIALAWAGLQPPEGVGLAVAQLAAVCLGLFYVAVPVLGHRVGARVGSG